MSRFWEVRPLATVCGVFFICSAAAYLLPVYMSAIVACILAFSAAALFIKPLRVRIHKKIINALLLTSSLAFAVSALYFGVICGKIAEYKGDEHEITGIVYEVQSENIYSGRYKLNVRSVDGKKTRFKALLYTTYNAVLSDGDEISVKALASDISAYTRYFDYKTYARSQGIEIAFENTVPGSVEILDEKRGGLLYWLRALNHNISEGLSQYFSDDRLGLVSALILGDRTELSDAVKRDFTRAGLPHMLAISGMHLSVIIMLLSGFLDICRIGARVKRVLLFSSILFYMLLTGMPASVARASLMFFIALAAQALMRTADPVTSLFFSGALMLFVSPASVVDIGFLLSFTTTLGITTLGAAFSEKIKAIKEKALKNKTVKSGTARKLAAELLSVLGNITCTFSAILFSLPVVWIFFGRISLVSALTNLIFEYPLAILIGLSAAIAVLLPIKPLCLLLAVPANGIAQAILDGVKYFGGLRGIMVSLNYAFFPVIAALFIAAVIILLIVKKLSLKSFSLVCICTFAVYLGGAGIYELAASRSIRAVYQPVGKNDVICIRSGGVTLAIDSSDGSKKDIQIADGLVGEYFHSCDIDVFILTHLHARSVSQIAYLLDRCRVETVLLPSPYDEATKGITAEIETSAKSRGVIIEYFAADEDSIIKAGELKIETASIEFSGGSSHPTTSFSVGFDGELLYVGSSSANTAQSNFIEEKISDCSALIFGVHGPKQKRPPLISTNGINLSHLICGGSWDWLYSCFDLYGKEPIIANEDTPVLITIKK